MDKMLNLLPLDTKPCWLFQYHFLQKLSQELRCELSRLDLQDYISKPRELSLEANKHWEKRVLDSDKPAFSVLSAPEPKTEVNKAGNASTTNQPSTQHTQSLCYNCSNFSNNALKCRNPCSWSGNAPTRSKSRN